MKLFLIRHGNTFEAGEPVVWVGSQNDLPLTETGLEQAAIAGEYLSKTGIRLDQIFCGPLRRHRETAEAVAQRLDLGSPKVDMRLNEIDYGVWSGLTTAEIEAGGFAVDLQGWNHRGEWPTPGVFGGTEEAMATAVSGFCEDLTATGISAAAAVTSGGTLRYFLRVVPGAFEFAVREQSFKVATGGICELEFDGEGWQSKRWNFQPD